MTNQNRIFSKAKPIRVLLADDHPLLRAGFTMVLTNSGLIEVIQECSTAADACDEFIKYNPDVVVLDILFKEKMTGIDSLKFILENNPQAAVIMLSQHDQPRMIKESYQLGAKSFIPKYIDPQYLVEAIQQAALGKVYFVPEIAEKLATYTTVVDSSNPHDILNDREFSIYKLIAEDKSLKQIAEELNISPKSVSNSLYALRQKLGISRNSEITKHAIKYGVIELENSFP